MTLRWVTMAMAPSGDKVKYETQGLRFIGTVVMQWEIKGLVSYKVTNGLKYLIFFWEEPVFINRHAAATSDKRMKTTEIFYSVKQNSARSRLLSTQTLSEKWHWEHSSAVSTTAFISWDKKYECKSQMIHEGVKVADTQLQLKLEDWKLKDCH